MGAINPYALSLHSLAQNTLDYGLGAEQDEWILGVPFEYAKVGVLYEVVAIPDSARCGFITTCDYLVCTTWGSLVKSLCAW